MFFCAFGAIIEAERYSAGEEWKRMKQHEFAKGMGLGMVAGAALGAAMAPKKKRSVKKAAGKAMKTMGQVMENLSDDMGF